ncbi:MAG: MBL fold metallo-hydrolase [Thermoanaerobaculum sp.]|nr:MBL fold metallo-hydrolase [Thermoanaerobaculum sp.]
MATLTFLGATGTVTGSRYLLQVHGHRYLIDAGLFQGEKELRQRNWEPFPVEPKSLSAVILTHAHIDHSGYLPRLVRQGFSGPVYTTPSTRRLLSVLLPDAAHLQEEEAHYANKVGSTKHTPALPLFDTQDASRALGLLQALPFAQPHQLHPGCTFTFYPQGHILGAAAVEVRFKGANGQPVTVYFSGDVGRYEVPILQPPEPFPGSTYLVVESTYGDRLHDGGDPREALAEIISKTTQRGGVVLIPAFAVGRAQEVLYYLRELEDEGEITLPPVFLDSPMAREAMTLYRQATSEHDAETQKRGAEEDPFAPTTLSVVTTVAQSKSLNALPGPAVIISASGMATGGRILHHLRHRLPHPHNTLLFVGFQAKGTRGRRILDGEPTVKIFGEHVPVRAEIAQLSCLSAHADRDELLIWMRQAPQAPQRVFVTHGEPSASLALKELIQQQLGWPCHIPQWHESVAL